MKKSILIVDDEPKIVQQASDFLQKGGFETISAYDGKTALELFRSKKPDFLVLDLNLPEMDGLDVCRTIRKESDVPVIMLTARAEETDRLIGLELGADDYITKPFSPRELVARVRAVMRRVNKPEKNSSLVVLGNLEIDIQSHKVIVNGESVHLTRNEFIILSALAENPGQIFSREQLIEKIHGVRFEGVDRSIDAHVKNIRRKIEEDPVNPQYVLTIYGIGYKLNDELR